MRVGSSPPASGGSQSPNGTPIPNELFNDVNSLYFLLSGWMGINLKTASGETLQLSAQMFASLVNRLEAYYKANPPVAGSQDALLNSYLNETPTTGGPSLATLAANIEAAANGNPPTVDTADLTTLEKEFQDPNSPFSQVQNMITADPSKSYSYWYGQSISYNPQGFDPTLYTELQNFNSFASMEYQAMLKDSGDPTQQKLDAEVLANRMLTFYDEASNHTTGSDTNFGCVLINSLFNQLVPNPEGGAPVSILSIIQNAANGTGNINDFITLLGSGGDNLMAILQATIQGCIGGQGIWHPQNR